ncbi:TadE/TadG family type IV pilus assembly protein [Photobacterium nomapromontoriensis]|uniref:TadE/TadG family type IV pilus assembly protein n=1 Tax=Photobacterium nomapromontoriensis TaxID=2910237 RepID=UPI003D12825F
MAKYRQRGVTTIELALGCIALIFTTFMIFEICYKIYIVNVTEFALRETIRATKVYEGKNTHSLYQTEFYRILNRDNTLWDFLLVKDKFKLTSVYFKSYANIINNVAEDSKNPRLKYVLAEVTLAYQYAPIFTFNPSVESTISRTMLLNLEHEGWGNHD